MARTTAAKVEAIVEVKSTISVDPFIEVANNVVTTVCVGNADGDVYTAETLELIERWLSAHFYKIRDLYNAEEKTGKAEEKKQYKVGLNFNVTVYGQQALAIDPYGHLAKHNAAVESGKRKTVGITWGGTGDSDGNDISGE